MADSENTFADRHGRGELLHAAIAAFDPSFEPKDENLLPDNFLIFLNEVKAHNELVASLRSQYTTKVSERKAIVLDLKKRSSLIMSFIKSVSEYKKFYNTIGNITKRILAHKPPKTKTNFAAPETPEDVKKRNRGEQSYADLSGLLNSLISALGQISGYAPPNGLLTLVNLQALSTSFENQNALMNPLHSQISIEVKERYDMYYAENGLRDFMKRIKAAVRSQYDAESEQYASVKGINF